MESAEDVRQFLTAARARITPERAGVPMFGGERRVPGLRREEVAQLAGVSTGYYTRMERGDLTGVSDSVLLAVARGLQLDAAETAHLLDLGRAFSRPLFRTRAAAPRVTTRIAQLLASMGDVPAIAQDSLSDIVASNALGRALFPDQFPSGRPPINHVVYIFLDERARSFYTDWEATALSAVSAMRFAAGRDPSDRGLAALVTRLKAESPEFRRWWEGHTVRIHNSGVKEITHPIVGELSLPYEILEIPSSPGVRITSYLSDPGTPSADALDILRSWVATTPSRADAVD